MKLTDEQIKLVQELCKLNYECGWHEAETNQPLEEAMGRIQELKKILGIKGEK